MYFAPQFPMLLGEQICCPPEDAFGLPGSETVFGRTVTEALSSYKLQGLWSRQNNRPTSPRAVGHGPWLRP